MTRRRCDCCGDVFFTDYMVGWTCLSCRAESRGKATDTTPRNVPETS